MAGDLPRIFVGTLASGEAEFHACREAVAAQQGVSVTHHIIENQPEYEAHNMLWAAWDSHRKAHDLFVKIDADTVLNRDTALRELAAFFENPRVTGAQATLNDYFTDDLIVGPLTAFSPAVQFRNAKSRLFVDHADHGHDIVLKGDALTGLAPLGWHGKNPSPRQAFHFGFHRRLKKQHEVIRKTAAAWLKHQDAPREWALAGAASVRWWMRGRTHYASPSFRKRFELMADEAARHDTVSRFVKNNFGNPS